MMKLCPSGLNRKDSSKEKGSALIIVIAVIAMLTVLAISIASLAVSYYKITGRIDRTERAEYLAQSGTDKAIALLKNSGGSVDYSIPKYIDSSVDMMNIDVSGEPDVLSPTKVALFKADNAGNDKTSCATYVNLSDGGNDILVTSKAAVPYNNTHLYRTVQFKINKDKSFGANSSAAYMDTLLNSAFTIIDSKNVSNNSFTCGSGTSFNVSDNMILQGGKIDIFPETLNLGSQEIDINACRFRFGSGIGGTTGPNSFWNLLASSFMGTFTGFSPTVYYRCGEASEFKLQDLSNLASIPGATTKIINDSAGTHVKDYALLDVRKEDSINLYNANITKGKLYLVFIKGTDYYAAPYDGCSTYLNDSRYQYTGVSIYRTRKDEINSVNKFSNFYTNTLKQEANNAINTCTKFNWINWLININNIYKSATYFFVFNDGDLSIDSGTYSNLMLYSNGKVSISNNSSVNFTGQNFPIVGNLFSYITDDPILTHYGSYGGACICAKQFYLGDNSTYVMRDFRYVPDAAKNVLMNNLSSSNINIVLDSYNTH